MSYEGLGSLVAEIKEASRNIEAGDSRMSSRLDAIEKSVNDLYLKTQRPGGYGGGRDDDERKAAVDYCILKHDLDQPCANGIDDAYVPSSSRIEEAMVARKALTKLWRHGDPGKLDPMERKSLSAFSFSTNDFLLPPQMSNQVLSCIIDPTDVAGWVNRITISAGSIKFLIDNARMLDAGWACESSCFANNPQPDLQEGLGTLEIKAETIRYTACVTADLLQDAAFDVQSWLLEKVNRGFRNTINNAILLGTGIGMPSGLLSPNSGVPICETSINTQPGQFSWQDLIMLKFEIPMVWQPGCAFYMNQHTFSLLMTMSDAQARPLWSALPESGPAFMLAGSPIRIVSQLPDVQPGSTPILFGNLKAAYTLVDRQAVTFVSDPFSAGWCHLFRFSARVGGSTTCPNALRLLRIR